MSQPSRGGFKVYVHSARVKDIFDIHIETAPWLTDLDPYLDATVPGSKLRAYLQVRDDATLQMLLLKCFEMKIKLEVFVCTRQPNREMSQPTPFLGSMIKHYLGKGRCY